MAGRKARREHPRNWFRRLLEVETHIRSSTRPNPGAYRERAAGAVGDVHKLAHRVAPAGPSMGTACWPTITGESTRSERAS